jgi:hypothetical protein
MTHRSGIMVVALLCAWLAPAAHAAATKAPAKAKSKVTQPAPAKSGAAQSTRAPAAAGGVRTLDAIRIEGEIDVPQVLFITARDYRRFRDGMGARYQPTADDVAKSIALPSRLRMVALPE